MKEISYEGPLFNNEEEYWEESKAKTKAKVKMPPLRTFRTDVEELIQKKGTTPVQVALAEASRREERGEKRVLKERDESHLGRIIMVLSLVLTFGVGVGLYALIGSGLNSGKNEVATSTEITELPPATSDELSIMISDAPKEQVSADIILAFQKTTLPAGEKRTVSFMMRDPGGTLHRATISDFFTTLFLPIETEALRNSLEDEFTYEIYSGSTLTGVITVPSRSYANTFATMLEWEPKMAASLVPVLNAWYDRKYLNDLTGVPFKDERILNDDIRVLYDITGKSILAYGFSNKKTLIIAGNKDALVSALISHSQEK